jgi:lipoyl(octanoyl) transferase
MGVNGESEMVNRGSVPVAPARAADRCPLPIAHSPVIKQLGLVDYLPTYEAMRRFSAERDEGSADEIWTLQHPPVFTVGLAGRAEHLPRSGDIPIEHIDRGGQITYHGPGQAIVYLLLDLSRRDLKVRQLVQLAEQAAIDLLADFNIGAQRVVGAPGVYVAGAKIAALGLRIRKGCCYHGISLNVDMDLAPFSAIDPCGFPGLRVTQARDLGITAGTAEIGERLAAKVIQHLQ